MILETAPLKLEHSSSTIETGGGENSYASQLENYYTKKYNKNVSPIAILKTLAVISSEFTENNKLWILHLSLIHI